MAILAALDTPVTSVVSQDTDITKLASADAVGTLGNGYSIPDASLLALLPAQQAPSSGTVVSDVNVKGVNVDPNIGASVFGEEVLVKSDAGKPDALSAVSEKRPLRWTGSQSREASALTEGPIGDATAITSHQIGKTSKDFGFKQFDATTATVERSNGGKDDTQSFKQLERLSAVASLSTNAETEISAVTVAVGRESRPREQTIFKSQAIDISSSQVIGTDSTLQPQNVGGVNGAAQTVDAYVAEQVSYWISSDVKNAELKLDGLGADSVGVSISVQGNEAQVAFHTDDLQVRAVLESAATHLKDLLQREGMVLSGVSIGASGSGDFGSQDRKERQGAKQTGTVLIPVREIPTTQSMARSAGRTLDLFV
jgi:hypothetical protein